MVCIWCTGIGTVLSMFGMVGSVDRCDRHRAASLPIAPLSAPYWDELPCATCDAMLVELNFRSLWSVLHVCGLDKAVGARDTAGWSRRLVSAFMVSVAADARHRGAKGRKMHGTHPGRMKRIWEHVIGMRQGTKGRAGRAIANSASLHFSGNLPHFPRHIGAREYPNRMVITLGNIFRVPFCLYSTCVLRYGNRREVYLAMGNCSTLPQARLQNLLDTPSGRRLACIRVRSC